MVKIEKRISGNSDQVKILKTKKFPVVIAILKHNLLS